MYDQLVANFSDGSDAEVNFIFDERIIIITAYDDKTVTRYKLIFSECIYFEMNYTEEDNPDIWNFTDGIQEITSSKFGIRIFAINFAGDDVILKIMCRKFTMSRID